MSAKGIITARLGDLQERLNALQRGARQQNRIILNLSRERDELKIEVRRLRGLVERVNDDD